MNWSLIAAVNNQKVLESCLLSSPDIHTASEVIFQRGYSSAAQAYNEAICKSNADVLVFAHQDVFFPIGWAQALEKSIETISKEDPRWGVLGVWGIRRSGDGVGLLYCSAAGRTLGTPFEGGQEVQSLDEVVLIVRKSSGLRFDENLSGFHFYGSDICLEARRRGLKSYAISAFCLHNTNGYAMLPLDFWKTYLAMRRKWMAQLPVTTPCIEVTWGCLPMIRWNMVRAANLVLGREKPPAMRAADARQLYWEKMELNSQKNPVDQKVPEVPPVGKSSKSYGQILKSSALIGGSSVISILLGIIRTKILAVLLGPSGVGLLGLFNSVVDTLATPIGAGITTCGVRQIAEACAQDDPSQIARRIVTLRRMTLLLSVAGALLLFLFRKPICELTFGNTDNASSVGLLSAALFLVTVAAGEAAVVQGMRRIRDLAVMSVMGGLLGTIFSVPIVFVFGTPGIVSFLLMTSAMLLLSSWWQSRKIPLAPVRMKWSETRAEAIPLIKLGMIFTVAAASATSVAYLVRVIVTRRFGIESAGIYQAVWALSSMYVGFILQAMGKDFFPRLTACAKDNAECNRLVNEQVEVSLLLAAPGVLCTLSLASLVIPLFYSAKFGPAVEILRWQAMGMLLRVITWPLGFLLLAKGENKMFLWTELLTNLFYVCLTYLATKWWGLLGTGISFFVLYVIYGGMIFGVARHVSDFKWSASTVRIGSRVLLAMVFVFLLFWVLSDVKAAAAGMVVSLAVGVYSVKRLHSLAGPELFLAMRRKLWPS